MNIYTAKDQKEMDEIIKKILAKDRGAFVHYYYSTIHGLEFPLQIQTSVRIKHSSSADSNTKTN
jgi:hypothetical protein